MKVLMNTNYQSAGVKICMDDMAPKFIKLGHQVIRNDWHNYQNYDLILFMAPDSQIIEAKKINPRAITGMMLPTLTKSRIKEIQSADFLLVSSIEHRDFFLKYNKNIFIYYSFPEITAVFKEHTAKEKIIIGYHGNKVHLDCMSDVRKALDKLADKYNIELWAIYNIKKLGQWKKNLPKKCPVKHIQWSEDSYYDYLGQADIGIVPAKTPTKFLFKGFGLKRYDYLIRFKYSSNPGRAYIFSQFHIPVVADFLPSSAQIIQDGESGYLVWSEEGWYNALEKLIISPDLRNKMSRNLKNFIDNNYSPDLNFRKFSEFIKKIK